MIAFDLVVLNSGTLPARNVRITAADESLATAFGQDATAANKERWLACFKRKIGLLQNNDRVSCSFGTTKRDDGGFWKVNASIQVTVTYEGWFGSTYTERQELSIVDSNSFTGYAWGTSS
jgi:hypothetical protein